MPVCAAGPERVLTWAGEPLNTEADGLMNRRGKLDTVVVNGPEDVAVEWDFVDWRVHEQNVVRLRRRIFKATREQDWATVRSLQKLMLGSWSNTLISMRQVTQRNTGRRTAGIDGEVALSSPERAEMAVRVHRSRSDWDPLPVRRVYIPKASDKTKLRPLGIPVLMDRCHQARVRNALEPEWEARFEARSYGFRPGRSCADAIGSLYATLHGPRAQRVWILDADLSAAFDRIDHPRLLDALDGFPARGLVARWLRAGVIEEGRFSPTEQGSPQGGVFTPPTQWAMSGMVVLRVGVGGGFGVVGGAFADRDTVPDGDLVGSDENVFDEQPQHALAFVNGGQFGLGVKLGEEAFEVGGELEIGLAVGELVVERLDLVAQVGFSSAQIGHACAQLIDGDQLFAERLDHAGDGVAGLGQCGIQSFPLLCNRIGGARRVEAPVDLGVDQLRVGQQPGDVIPHYGVEMIGAHRLIAADPPALVALVSEPRHR